METLCPADLRRRETGRETIAVYSECDAEIVAVGPDARRGRIEIREG